MIVTGEYDEEVKYDMNLHKCPRPIKDKNKCHFIEEPFRKFELKTFIIISCCFLLLGLFFVYVLKSSQ